MNVELKHADKRGAGTEGSIHKTNMSWKWISIPLKKQAESESQRFFFLLHVDYYK